VALPYYDLADVIFNPKLVKAAIDKREVRASMEKYGVNEPQAGAIVAAMNTEGFSLIQGWVQACSAPSEVFTFALVQTSRNRKNFYHLWLGPSTLGQASPACDQD